MYRYDTQSVKSAGRQTVWTKGIAGHISHEVHPPKGLGDVGSGRGVSTLTVARRHHLLLLPCVNQSLMLLVAPLLVVLLRHFRLVRGWI